MSPRRLLRAAVTVGLLMLVAALTRIPWRPATDPAATARLRLSWRARGAIIQHCRKPTAAELANTPAHMRQAEICEGARVAPYGLRVVVDGRPLLEGRVAGSGEAGEGTLYLLHEFPLAAGAHRVMVDFARQDGDDARDDAAPAASARGDHRHAIPARLSLDTTLVLAPRQVILITYAPETERLVVIDR